MAGLACVPMTAMAACGGGGSNDSAAPQAAAAQQSASPAPAAQGNPAPQGAAAPQGNAAPQGTPAPAPSTPVTGSGASAGGADDSAEGDTQIPVIVANSTKVEPWFPEMLKASFTDDAIPYAQRGTLVGTDNQPGVEFTPGPAQPPASVRFQPGYMRIAEPGQPVLEIRYTLAASGPTDVTLNGEHFARGAGKPSDSFDPGMTTYFNGKSGNDQASISLLQGPALGIAGIYLSCWKYTIPAISADDTGIEGCVMFRASDHAPYRAMATFIKREGAKATSMEWGNKP